MSKNLGRDTPSSIGIKTFPPHHPRTITPHWSQDSRQHHLHRPVDKYFSDKQEQQRKQEEEERLARLSEKSQEDAKIAEIEKIANLIREEKNKIRFCFLCNRKFASLQHLEAHEAQSDLHKKNLEMKKSQQLQQEPSSQQSQPSEQSQQMDITS